MPLMMKIWFTYAELAMLSYYVLWYLRCQIFSGALLPCTAYQASWLLDYTAAPGHSQTDWKGNNIFFIAFCITSRKWDTFFQKLFFASLFLGSKKKIISFFKSFNPISTWWSHVTYNERADSALTW